MDAAVLVKLVSEWQAKYILLVPVLVLALARAPAGGRLFFALTSSYGSYLLTRIIYTTVALQLKSYEATWLNIDECC